MNKVFLGLFILVAGCSTVAAPPPEPVVVTQIVREPYPVPCEAFSALGAEPEYADNRQALTEALNIFVQSQLLLVGREQRNQRLKEYQIVREACENIE